jgi:hypothetical protein
VNAHCPTKEATVASLQFRINGMLNHHWRLNSWWLRCVPFLLSLIELAREQQFKPPLPYGLFPSFA